ncbi:large ribosomal subunit protein eL20z-like [Bidens hawaiensis]|uniref:large ribosomal subunit protein eL20z-like n=1 Tax=Bidens hawaiensis TaxID=980011 RepID=UPI00404B033E
MTEPEQNNNNQHHYQHHPDQPPPAAAAANQYGTFQGVHNYPPQPVIGFPQPVPPHGAHGGPTVNAYVHGYQTVPGYAISEGVAEGRPVREPRLPCCGIGIGWFLFILGFFFAAIPWYVGAFILLCAQYDIREKPGYVACLIAAIIGTIAVIFGVTS